MLAVVGSLPASVASPWAAGSVGQGQVDSGVACLPGPTPSGPSPSGPFLVGPFLPGSSLVGPFPVGSSLVGPFPVGPFLVGPFLVGPSSPGPCLADLSQWEEKQVCSLVYTVTSLATRPLSVWLGEAEHV